tara:strand:+ start:248 stop:484 length:237 start_codon:yes stop_codon:yes gene_type:complete
MKMNNVGSEKSPKTKYFRNRDNYFKSEIWELNYLMENGDINIKESEKEIEKLQKRRDRNDRKYMEYKDSDEYRQYYKR